MLKIVERKQKVLLLRNRSEPKHCEQRSAYSMNMAIGQVDGLKKVKDRVHNFTTAFASALAIAATNSISATFVASIYS